MVKVMSEDSAQSKFSLVKFKNLFTNSGRINKYLFGEKKFLSLSFIVVIVILAISPFLINGVQGALINNLVKLSTTGAKNIDSELILLLIVLLFLSVLTPLFMAVQNYLNRLIYFYTEKKYELLIIEKKGDLDIAAFENPEKSDLINTVRENGRWRVQAFTERQFFILQNVIEVFLATAVILYFQWWLFFVIFLGLIPLFLVEIKYGNELWSIHGASGEKRRKYWDNEGRFNFLPSLIELKLFQNSHYFLKIISDLLKSFHQEEKLNDRRNLWLKFIVIFVNQATIAIATVWFVLMVIWGQLEVGTLIFLLASIGNLTQSLSGFFKNIATHYQDSLFITDLFEFLNLKAEIVKPISGIKLNSRVTPEIVFDNVSFAYPGTGKMVFSNFSLKISPGEKIALVGVNGAGKTTFVKLLCRFYDPSEGRILINGEDIRNIDLDSWYNLLGALFQEYAHYNLLIKEAIAVGRTKVDINLQQVKQAARSSEADVFIEKLDQKYDQVLGKQFTGGVEPSIGQWQKLALARTFYRDPLIYILDEPTSSIDAQAEGKIFEKLESLPEDRTVFLISHRFSTVRKADRIIVLEDGQIKELGSHDELMKLNGKYAKLFNLQAKGYQ